MSRTPIKTPQETIGKKIRFSDWDKKDNTYEYDYESYIVPIFYNPIHGYLLSYDSKALDGKYIWNNKYTPNAFWYKVTLLDRLKFLWRNN